MGIKFHHCTVINIGQAYLYYRYDKTLMGYFITSIAIANTIEAKRNFVEVLKYFFTEIVRGRDSYCSLFDNSTEFFSKYTTTSQDYNGSTVYKMKPYKDIVK